MYALMYERDDAGRNMPARSVIQGNGMAKGRLARELKGLR
jgi:hypothetical protein